MESPNIKRATVQLKLLEPLQVETHPCKLYILLPNRTGKQTAASSGRPLPPVVQNKVTEIQ